MSFIKEEMENNNNLDLHAIKVELNALILKYYHDLGATIRSTQHLHSVMTKYCDWNNACCYALTQLNIPHVYQIKAIEHNHMVSVWEIKKRMRSSLKLVAYLSDSSTESDFSE